MKLKYILLLHFLLIGLACSDVFERDLSGETLSLMAPPDNYITKKPELTFWWTEIKYAREYRLQIVEGSFAFVEALILDSLVTSNQFNVLMDPGQYQWRVFAQNAESEIMSVIRTFRVDSAQNISEVVIGLINPKKGLITNNDILTFEWQGNVLVDDYRFELRSPDFQGNLVFPAQLLTTTSYSNTADLLDDGTYEWGVRGQAGNSNSEYSTASFTIDKTPPATPVLSAPANNSNSSTAKVNFTWQRSTDLGTAVKDSFYIFSDSNLTAPASPVYILDDPSHTDSLAVGSYFWYVRSFDQAGNTSGSSTVWKFSIIP